MAAVDNEVINLRLCVLEALQACAVVASSDSDRGPPRTARKKTDVVEHSQVFRHIGLLCNEPPEAVRLLFIQSPDSMARQLLLSLARREPSYGIPATKQGRCKPIVGAAAAEWCDFRTCAEGTGWPDRRTAPGTDAQRRSRRSGRLAISPFSPELRLSFLGFAAQLPVRHLPMYGTPSRVTRRLVPDHLPNDCPFVHFDLFDPLVLSVLLVLLVPSANFDARHRVCK
jgi:hypothetical protein